MLRKTLKNRSSSSNEGQNNNDPSNSSVPDSSAQDPCCSKSLRDEKPEESYSSNVYDEHSNSQGPSTSRGSSSLKRVEWDTLERNWSGYSNSGSSWRGPANRPPPIPTAKYVSKKGKGIGKGRRNIERALTFGALELTHSPSRTFIDSSKDDYTHQIVTDSEPMDLSTKDVPIVPKRIDREEDPENSDLEIDLPFEDTVAIVGQPVTLTCIVTGNAKNFKWFKNGKEIKFDSRIQALDNKDIFTLKINETVCPDHGVYRFEVRNSSKCKSCRGKLFVGVDATRLTPICIGLTPRYALDVIEPLKHVTVLVGDSFELSATFMSRAENYRWFKDEIALMTDCRCVITSTEYTSTLAVNKSTVSDSGIYVVVSKSKFGITSSWSDVVVFDDVKLPDLNNEFEPYIEEMPINTVAYEGEEVRLFCKVRSNFRADVKWYRKNRDLVIGGRIEETDYGDCYLGLRIQNVVSDDSDKYGIELIDKLNINDDPKLEACRVTVLPDHWDEEEVTLVKPLMSSILTYGSSVTLYCRFDVSRCKHYFMCWYIGHHKITYTDSRFRVAGKHGICLIRILKMEPGMTGEVTCQIRSLLSNGTSIVRAFTTCNLAIVPSSVLVCEMSMSARNIPCEIMSGKYSEWSNDGLVSTSETQIRKSGFHENQPPLPINQILFYIEYCRLEDDYYYYLNVIKEIDDDKVILMTICECQPDPHEGRLHRIVKIEWEYQGSKSEGGQNVWYRVDYQLPSGHYAPTAFTSEPQIFFINPIIDEQAKFRISTVVPDSMTKDAAISITHRPNEPDGLPEDFEPRATYNFSKHYQNLTGAMGHGAYGLVSVAKCLLTGTEYAVKTLPLRTFDHRDTCSRELSLLKSLRHPKIVSLVDAYRDDLEAKLVMECLWGKELFDRIADNYHVVETDVIPYVRQICDALAYLHDRNIVHLDIKPENVMCVHPNSRQIKLVDFGLARRLNPAYKTMVLNGTRNYVSPEILRFDQLTVKTDMWSVGVVTYMLRKRSLETNLEEPGVSLQELSGLPPFLGENWPEESGNILRGEYNYEDRAFWEVSDLAKDFIDKLLVLDVNRRSSARQAMEHPWLREGPGERPFKSFKSNSTTKLRWQKARFAMIAAQRFRRHRFRHHYVRLGITQGRPPYERP